MSLISQEQSVCLWIDADELVSEWAKEKGYPVTDLYTSHYISNLVKFGQLKKNDDGTLTITSPTPDDAPLPNYAVEQTGGWVSAIFNNPDEYIGELYPPEPHQFYVAPLSASRSCRTLN